MSRSWHWLGLVGLENQKGGSGSPIRRILCFEFPGFGRSFEVLGAGTLGGILLDGVFFI